MANKHAKKLHISHKGNENQNPSDIFHTHQDGDNKSTDVGDVEDVEKLEPPYTSGGHVTWCGHCGCGFAVCQSLRVLHVKSPSATQSFHF